MKKKLTFEEGMAELEKLVLALEGGSLALEESFAAYARGMELSEALGGILREGDARIVALKKALGGETAQEDISAEVAP
ncbi:MAG: exodeoxyribonuclease VII small subunit [Clostridiales bacterium]|nr:exodeoxyribonuclease VII small subunit [Clostridiales bacterium]